MNPYLSGARPQFLTSPANGKRKIQTPQKLILPSIQNNANSKTSISSKNPPNFNIGSPRTSNLIDFHSLSTSNPFHQQNKIFSDLLIKSEAPLESKRLTDSVILQSPKSRINHLYPNQSPLLSKQKTRESSIDSHASLNNLDRRIAATEESPTLRRKESLEFAEKSKYNSLADSLENLSHQDTCNTSRAGTNSARSPHDEVLIRPRDPKASPHKNSKKLLTIDGKVKVEKTFHSVETSPKMNINIPGLKAIFLKEKANHESAERTEATRERFTGRTMNRSLTEQIAHKQRERALLNELGASSPRLNKDTVGQLLLDRLKSTVESPTEFPVTFTPIRTKKEILEPSPPSLSSVPSLPKITDRNPEKGMTLAEYFSQEEEKRKQQRTVHETVADKVIEEESESNISVLQEEQADLEHEALQIAWPQRGNTFKKKTRYVF